MIMPPGVRRLALTAHVTTSVGWLGAVGTFLVLALAGLSSANEQTVRAAYLAMELIGWSVIVPLCLASVPTGLIMSLGTSWGLVRHYWVVAKLVIGIIATILLLVHMQPVGHLARVVAETTLQRGELAGLRLQLVADAGAAVVALIAATALSIYKPWGLTPSGVRALNRSPSDAVTRASPRMVRIAMIAGIVLVVLVVLRHLFGGGMRH